MEGKYLRQINPTDTQRDPTMSHVPNLAAIRPGDIVRDWSDDRRIVKLEHIAHNIRFAYLAPIDNRVRRGGTRIHDLRIEYTVSTYTLHTPRIVFADDEPAP